MTHVHTEAPSQYLADQIDLLKTAPDNTALDVACGKGRNSLFLAQNGFTVTGVELNDQSIAATRAAAESLNLPVTVERIDLETGRAELPVVGFGVVCVFYYLHRPLMQAIRNAVAPGGFVIYETFLVDQHERWGRPRRAEFALGRNELLDVFMGFRVHHYEERVDERAETAIARIIAQRV